MTLNEFRAKYRLQQRLTQRGVASYHAVDSSGRVVMVHSLDSASREEVDQVRGMIHRLNPDDRKRILEILDVEGAPVIVTEYLQAFQALSHWLEVRTRGDPTQPAVTPATSNELAGGEFTQFFGPAAPAKTPIVETPPPPSQPPGRVAGSGGEFTQLFGAIQANPPAVGSAPEPAKAPAPPAPKQEGEFTRLFGAIKEEPAPPAPPAPPPSTPPPAPVKPAGDFTRLFGAGTGAPATSATPIDAPSLPTLPITPPPAEPPKIVVRWRDAAAPEPPPPPADKPMIRWKESGAKEAGADERKVPQKGPGDFTRLFGPQETDKLASLSPDPIAPADPIPPATRADPPPRQGVAKEGFTQLLQKAVYSSGEPTDSPERSDAPPSSPPPSKAAPGAFTSLMSGLPTPGGGAPGPAAPSAPGPSEFTRMMSAMPESPSAPSSNRARAPAPPPPPPPPPPAEDEDTQQRPSFAKLFIALGVVLLLAVALVVFFAIKK